MAAPSSSSTSPSYERGDSPLSQYEGADLKGSIPPGGPEQSRSGRGQQAANPRKRSLSEEIIDFVGQSKRKRKKRIRYSCSECHRRKHKCDRQMPCGSCVDRGISDLCRPAEDNDQEDAQVKERIRLLEQAVVKLIRGDPVANRRDPLGIEDWGRRGHVGGGMTTTEGGAESSLMNRTEEGGGASHQDEAMILASLRDRIESGSEGVKFEEPSSRTVEKPSTSSDHGGNSHNSDVEGELARDGDGWYGAQAVPSVSKRAIATQVNGKRLTFSAESRGLPSSFQLRRLIKEGGAPEGILVDLVGQLPAKLQTERLIDVFFRDINECMNPIDEADFRRSYNNTCGFLWDRKAQFGEGGARHISFLALLLIIVATVLLSQPPDMGSEVDGSEASVRLCHAAARSISVATAIKADDLNLVHAYLYLSRFFIVQRKAKQGWSTLGSAIRAAQAIGLHRDGRRLGLDGVATEKRRRAWSLVYYADKTTSMLLGRPQAIHESCCDTLPPSAVELPAKPLAGSSRLTGTNSPGVYIFVRLRHELARITGKVIDHFQNVSTPRRYTNVLAIDAELENFRRALPSIYRLEVETGNSQERDRFDALCPWLPFHRFLLNMEWCFVRIALHRPYFIANSEKYAQSKALALESAKADRNARIEFRSKVSWGRDRARKTFLAGLFRYFNATLTFGIALLMKPRGPEASEYRSYLEEFVELHRHQKEDPDQMNKQEVEIIQLFLAKASNPASSVKSDSHATRKRAASSSSRAKGGGGGGGKGDDGAQSLNQKLVSKHDQATGAVSSADGGDQGPRETNRAAAQFQGVDQSPGVTSLTEPTPPNQTPTQMLGNNQWPFSPGSFTDEEQNEPGFAQYILNTLQIYDTENQSSPDALSVIPRLGGNAGGEDSGRPSSHSGASVQQQQQHHHHPHSRQGREQAGLGDEGSGFNLVGRGMSGGGAQTEESTLGFDFGSIASPQHLLSGFDYSTFQSTSFAEITGNQDDPSLHQTYNGRQAGTRHDFGGVPGGGERTGHPGATGSMMSANVNNFTSWLQMIDAIVPSQQQGNSGANAAGEHGSSSSTS
ncbi:hypothetical protein IE53DRAFT_378431 [Violaceomyces palustris]|uniref:Uncharacterized protein n=1 Tax=Violaceomyces palustris TaxID=1673888 RepID=A0ACD0P260_9BASI|nr:hypothetical protein IE53DRAFT_378431 [Violaceomyces palustris]